MAPGKPRYVEGEKVLCFHGPLLYEAKCLKFKIEEKGLIKYFIHYSGWNKNWDEWVPESRVLRFCDANVQKQQELANTYMKSKKAKTATKVVEKKKEQEKEAASTSAAVAGPSTSADTDTSPKPKSPEKSSISNIDLLNTRRLWIDSLDPASHNLVSQLGSSGSATEIFDLNRLTIPVEPCFFQQPEPPRELKVLMTPDMKDWLIDDWDHINRQKKVLRLPARVTIDSMIASYVREKVSPPNKLTPREEGMVILVTNKLRDCFNALLGKMLLYKFERVQYADFLAQYPEKRMSELYGVGHLLRLFTILGEKLTNSGAPMRHNTKLMVHINDFALFISKHEEYFDCDDYIVTSAEYHRRSNG